MEAVSGISKPFGDTLEILDFNYQNLKFFRIFLITFYSVFFVLMGIWQNKAISHCYMLKSIVLILEISVEMVFAPDIDSNGGTRFNVSTEYWNKKIENVVCVDSVLLCCDFGLNM